MSRAAFRRLRALLLSQESYQWFSRAILFEVGHQVLHKNVREIHIHGRDAQNDSRTKKIAQFIMREVFGFFDEADVT